MRIATWNVNSLRARWARVEEWLAYARPDVLCLQETKMADAAFPRDAVAATGYEGAHHGDGRWNGVAILSRVGLDGVQAGFAGDDPTAGAECRLLSATCGGVRGMSVYVPNGRSLDDAQYAFKLEWLRKLRGHLDTTCDADEAVAVCGDFNIAPTDADVWDPSVLAGMTHVSEPERLALADIETWGLVDVFRSQHPEAGLYSWWDYRSGAFHQHRGMRIDLVLASRLLAERSTFSLIDRQARKGPQPSDHAPVLVDV